jgi:hypothetical protein
MLCDDNKEALEAAKDGTVNNNRPRRGFVALFLRRTVFEVESDRQLEVQLDGRALMRPFQRVVDVDVDLGTVESAVTGIERPLAGIVPLKNRFQLLYIITSDHEGSDRRSERAASAASQVSISPKKLSGRVESSIRNSNPNKPYTYRMKSNRPLISSSICQQESMTEFAVQPGSLDGSASQPYLGGHAEYVGVVLDESSHASQAGQRAGSLVAMDDAEFRHTNGKLTVAAVSAVEDHAMTRTVHGFQRPLLLVYVKEEHVVLVVRPMARGLPELAVVHVG